MRLSWSAGRGEGGVAPLVLRVQAELFSGARGHDRDSIAAFEALALALLPKVDPGTRAEVARLLDGHPRLPASLRALLAQAGEAQTPSPDPAALGGLGLQDLVDRAAADPPLARELLDREDLPALEAARLYLHADEARRARIREALAGAGMAGRRPVRLRRAPPEAVTALMETARERDHAGFARELHRLLGLRRAPQWRFEEPARRDLLALAASAIGLCEEDAIRIFLTLEPSIAASVEAVFGLVAIFRRTPRSVAAMILEALFDEEILPRRPPQEAPPAQAPSLAERAAGLARQAARGEGSRPPLSARLARNG